MSVVPSVSAIGPKIWPSGPFMVNNGNRAQTMMIVEKNRLRSTSPEARMMRSLSGSSEFSPELTWR